MAEPSDTRLRDILSKTIGPAPWYCKTFPRLNSASEPLVWTHHGDEGPLGYVVSLDRASSQSPLLALNTYCRPFVVSPKRLGIWCPEGRSIRLACFDVDELAPFDLAEIAGWFKRSSERIFSATPPVADFEIATGLPAGAHKIDVPGDLQEVEELIVPTSYPAKSVDEPAFAISVFYLHAGIVEVLPQRWFTSAQYEVGKQWITRAARDSESGRILGECFGVGSFVLQADGCRLERWFDRGSVQVP